MLEQLKVDFFPIFDGLEKGTPIVLESAQQLFLVQKVHIDNYI